MEKLTERRKRSLCGVGLLSIAIGTILFWKRGSPQISSENTTPETEMESQTDCSSDLNPYCVMDESAIGQQEMDKCCFNDTVLTYAWDNGMELRVGMKSEKDNGIYLDPNFKYPNARHPSDQYGYLIRTNRGRIEYSSSEDGPSPAFSTSNYYLCNLLITGRTYDTLVPATYFSEAAYGVKWTPDRDAEGLVEETTDLSIHVIRLSDGMLMASVQATIEYYSDMDCFSLKRMVSADVKNTGTLSFEEREALIQEAVSFLNTGNGKIEVEYSEEQLRNYHHLIWVEKLKHPIFSKLYDAAGTPIRAASLNGYELFAVHLPYVGLGFLTVYFAPATQNNGFKAAAWGGVGEKIFCVVGYDALSPFSKSSFKSFLLPEDEEFFSR